MASNKLARTNDDIQRVLANLLTQVKDPRVQQGMISVTRVETTGDLRYSKVWLSVLGMENEKEFKKGLRSASGWLRHELGTVLDLRYTPELVFEIDHSIEEGAHISAMIEHLHDKDTGKALREQVRRRNVDRDHARRHKIRRRKKLRHIRQIACCRLRIGE